MELYDYNSKGIDYTYKRLSNFINFYGLPDQTTHHLFSLRRELDLWARQGNETTKNVMEQLTSCLHKLEGGLLYSYRIGKQIENLAKIPYNQFDPVFGGLNITLVKRGDAWKDITTPEDLFSSPTMIQIAAPILELDIESFLLQGVAMLDRLATFVYERYPYVKANGKAYRYYSQLHDFLNDHKSKHQELEKLLLLVTECNQYLAGILISDGTQKTLRNYIAHQSSLAELSQEAFIFHVLEDGKVLRFDNEVLDSPLLASIRKVSTVLPYLMVQAIGILLSGIITIQEYTKIKWIEKTDRMLFEPTWSNPTIYFKDYIDPHQTGPRFTVAQIRIDGFRIHSYHLREEILLLAE